MRELFRVAEEHAPSIVFIDEIDAIGTKRYDSNSGGEREIQRTMLELLNQLDGFDSRGDVKVRVWGSVGCSLFNYIPFLVCSSVWVWVFIFFCHYYFLCYFIFLCSLTHVSCILLSSHCHVLQCQFLRLLSLCRVFYLLSGVSLLSSFSLFLSSLVCVVISYFCLC